MAGMSAFGRAQSLAAMMIPSQYIGQAVFFLALCTVVPTAYDNGSSIVEPTASAYQRAPYGVDTDFWTANTDGTVFNAQEIDFAAPNPLEADWGMIKGWALCTDASGGNTCWLGELVTPRRVLATSSAVTIGIGGLVLGQV